MCEVTYYTLTMLLSKTSKATKAKVYEDPATGDTEEEDM